MQKFWILNIICLAAALRLCAQNNPVISSLNQNGALVCTNLQPGTTAVVEWASSLDGPWTNSWAGLDAVTVGTNSSIQVNVPMFYRVRGVAVQPLAIEVSVSGLTLNENSSSNF